MSTNHTPGPWVPCKNHAWGKVADIRTESGDAIAFCQTLHEPDAHLIAAAPYLLDALVQWQNAERDCDPEEMANACQSRDHAISKATGKDTQP